MQEYVLALNCGSSSVKFNLFRKIENNLKPHIQGMVEEIGNSVDSRLRYRIDGERKLEERKIADHGEALQLIFEEFSTHGIDTGDIVAIGHRVVHGGEKYTKSVLIDDNIIKTIEELIPIAPLHNPPNLTGIMESLKLLRDVPQVAVFDTAFHGTIPEYAYRYAIPNKWYREFGVRRYGFHGTSHIYVAKRAAKMSNIDFDKFNCITVHLGNGCSIAKVINGKSCDTSMGFTPLEGLIMGTRSGDIDSAIISHVADCLMKEKGICREEAFGEVMHDLNKESGLKALSGTNMMQYIREKAEKGDQASQLAVSIYAYRVAKYIGSYWATMPGVHGVIFTAGLGENEGYVRKEIMEVLANLDVEVYEENNKVRGEEIVIGKSRNSGTVFMVIPTDEEIVIAYDALNIGYLKLDKVDVYPFEI